MSDIYLENVGAQIPTGVNLAYDDLYVKPAQFKIDIKSPDGSEIYHSYNGFHPLDSEFAVTKIDILNMISGTRSFEIGINDSRDRIIDIDKVGEGNIVVIQMGKTEETLQNIFYGICYRLNRKRRHVQNLSYIMKGYGGAIVTNHTYMNFVKTAPSTTLQSGTKQFADDPRFSGSALFKQLFNDGSLPVSGSGGNLAVRGNFSLDKIADDIKEIIYSVQYPTVLASDICDGLANSVGGYWYVNENNEVIFRYAHGDYSGHIIKAIPEELDSGDYTSYFMNDLEVESSIDPGEGYANLLFGVADQTDIISVESRAIDSINLYNKDLCVMTYPGPARFRDLTFILSKKGAGTDALDPSTAKLYGCIVEDIDVGTIDNANHTPTGGMVANFSIPISEIQQSPAPISKINLKFVVNEINISKPHWIILFERGDSDDNTIYWWHNSDYTTKDQWMGIRPLPAGGRTVGSPARSNIGWVVSSHGPTFTHAFATSQPILCMAYDPISIDRWTPGRPVEAKIDASWIKNAKLMDEYLGQLIEITAQKPLIYGTNLVTIPNILFKPVNEVQLIDEIIGIKKSSDIMAQIQQVHYWASSDVDSSDATGNQLCEVDLKGWQSPLEYYNK